jgi:hypothetical protein
MTTIYEIPLSGSPQSFNIALPISNTVPPVSNLYRLVFQYRDGQTGMGGWVVDIYDGNGNPLLCGAPLVTGTDLLAQFAYLNFGAMMYVYSDGQPDLPPTFDNLGTGSHVLWITEP